MISTEPGTQQGLNKQKLFVFFLKGLEWLDSSSDTLQVSQRQPSLLSRLEMTTLIADIKERWMGTVRLLDKQKHSPNLS